MLAGIRTADAARQIAVQGISAQTPQRAEVKLAYSNSGLYVFNRAGSGYVIVSAHDGARPILGYSDAGQFDAGNMPEAMRELLESYTQQLQWLDDGTPLVRQEEDALDDGDTEASLPVSIAPLLADVRFSQKDPFNRLCPAVSSTNTDKSAAGCVAVAMAQIMKYYRYPAQGSGSHSYTTKTSKTTCSADFGNTTYNWPYIFATYDANRSEQACNAVATLVYHCGVSVDMNYGSSSGASSDDVPAAMNEYFCYDANSRIAEHYYHTNAQWDRMLKEELAAGRPVYMAGHNPDAGHAFVCDGYDASGYFHFNWGWGGKSNGYFTLDCLNGLTPLNQGTGGSDSGYGQKQRMILGLQPALDCSPKPELCMGKGIKVQESTCTLEFVNRWACTFEGSIGLAAYSDGELTQTYTLSSNATIASTYSLKVTVTPSKFSASKGQLLRPVYKRTGEEEWHWATTEVCGFHALSLTSAGKFAEYRDDRGRVTLSDLHAVNALYKGYSAQMSVTLSNVTGYEFNSEVYVRIIDANNKSAYSDKINMIVEAGEERTFQLAVPLADLAEGPVKAYVCYNGRNGSNYHMSGTYEDPDNKVNYYTLNAEPEMAPDLKVSLLTFADHPTDTLYAGSSAVLRAAIVNYGGYGEYTTRAVVWCPPGTTSIASQGKHKVIYQEGTNIAEFPMQFDFEPGRYYVRIYYYDANNTSTRMPEVYSGSNKHYFYVVEAPTTAVASIEQVQLQCADYPIEGTPFVVRNRRLILIK